jgi:hypothetical protein
MVCLLACSSKPEQIVAQCQSPGTIIYVDPTAAPGGTGETWECALQDLQPAIAIANSGQQIWVAAGTYKPHVTDQAVGFQLETGVKMYGGFLGLSHPTAPEDDLGDRDFINNETILSGDIDGDGVLDSDNSHSVVRADNALASAELNGFIVELGYGGSGTGNNRHGAGIYCPVDSAPTLANLIVHTNAAVSAGPGTEPFVKGGGLYVGGTQGATMSISDCAFLSNESDYYGGGALVEDQASNVQFERCVFDSNHTDQQGGGLAVYGGTVILDDCDFTQNDAGGPSAQTANGGGIYMQRSTVTLRGCNLRENQAVADAATGGGLHNDHLVTLKMIRCTFVQNSVEAESVHGGGGAFLDNGTLLDCVFQANEVIDTGAGPAGTGGGVLCGSVSVVNSLFYDNYAWRGGAISQYFGGDNSTFINCTVTQNAAGDPSSGGGGGGFVFDAGSLPNPPRVLNSIAWGNTDQGDSIENAQILNAIGTLLTVSHSDIQDADAGDANIPFGGSANGNLTTIRSS